MESDVGENDNRFYTIGHSNHSIGQFTGLLRQHGITAIADVRSTPYSRYLPQYNKDALAVSLEKEGIKYVFLGRELGARPDDLTCYENGRVDFGRLAEREEFKIGLERVRQDSERYRIALMCAEKEPLDCHRTILVCKILKQQGVIIKHILPDGAREDHLDTEYRLLKLSSCEQDLFNQDVSDSARLEYAYKKRASEIVYRRGNKAGGF